MYPALFIIYLWSWQLNDNIRSIEFDFSLLRIKANGRLNKNCLFHLQKYGLGPDGDDEQVCLVAISISVFGQVHLLMLTIYLVETYRLTEVNSPT